jgi:hypothetical protein
MGKGNLFCNMPSRHWQVEEVERIARKNSRNIGITVPVLNLGGGTRWVVTARRWALYPWEWKSVPIVQEAGWAWDRIWNGPESSVSQWCSSRLTVQPVVSYYTNCATPVALSALISALNTVPTQNVGAYLNKREYTEYAWYKLKNFVDVSCRWLRELSKYDVKFRVLCIMGTTKMIGPIFCP